MKTRNAVILTLALLLSLLILPAARAQSYFDGNEWYGEQVIQMDPFIVTPGSLTVYQVKTQSVVDFGSYTVTTTSTWSISWDPTSGYVQDFSLNSVTEVVRDKDFAEN